MRSKTRLYPSWDRIAEGNLGNSLPVPLIKHCLIVLMKLSALQ